MQCTCVGLALSITLMAAAVVLYTTVPLLAYAENSWDSRQNH